MEWKQETIEGKVFCCLFFKNKQIPSVFESFWKHSHLWLALIPVKVSIANKPHACKFSLLYVSCQSVDVIAWEKRWKSTVLKLGSSQSYPGHRREMTFSVSAPVQGDDCTDTEAGLGVKRKDCHISFQKELCSLPCSKLTLFTQKLLYGRHPSQHCDCSDE